MKRSIMVAILTATISPLRAQVPQGGASGQPSRVLATDNPVAANPRDVATADAIIAALYDANSVMVDRKVDADRFRSLFIVGGRLMPTYHQAGTRAMAVQTVEDYVKAATGGPLRHGFSEREVARTSQRFGNIMQVFSTYETHRDSADTHPGRGINSIQLFDDGHRWWVVGVLWDNERPNNPMPAVFLKNGPHTP